VKYVRSNSLLDMKLWYMVCSHDVIDINLNTRNLQCKGSNVHACAIISGSNIVLLHDVFHIGLVIGPRPAVLA
jgi:hypothetical protein